MAGMGPAPAGDGANISVVDEKGEGGKEEREETEVGQMFPTEPREDCNTRQWGGQ